MTETIPRCALSATPPAANPSAPSAILARLTRMAERLVEAATGVNLGRGRAKIEVTAGNLPYAPPPPRNDDAALLVSLARQKQPDTPACGLRKVWRIEEPHLVGLIQKSADRQRLARNYWNSTSRTCSGTSPRSRPHDLVDLTLAI
jgi:hypothetical protein